MDNPCETARTVTGSCRTHIYRFSAPTLLSFRQRQRNSIQSDKPARAGQHLNRRRHADSPGVQLTAWQDNGIRRGNAASPKISIGNNCNIRDNCHITAANGITIGDNLLTGTNVLITDNSHGAAERQQMDIHPQQRRLTSKGTVYIGNNVWLANNVCIMRE